MWYPDGIKIVPWNIAEFLTPLVLAIWSRMGAGKVRDSILTHAVLIMRAKFFCKMLCDLNSTFTAISTVKPITNTDCISRHTLSLFLKH